MADNKPTDEEFFDDELDQDGLSERLEVLDEELAIARAVSLRAGLEDYDLDDDFPSRATCLGSCGTPERG
jgi:GTP-binding protein